jgi:hypothetical protein
LQPLDGDTTASPVVVTLGLSVVVAEYGVMRTWRPSGGVVSP